MRDFYFLGKETVDMDVADMSDRDIHDKIVEEENLEPVIEKKGYELEEGDEVFHPELEEYANLESMSPVGDKEVVVYFEEQETVEFFDANRTFKVKK